MKFLLDENIDARLLPFLQELGHDVTSVAKDYLYGLLDEDVLGLAVVNEKKVSSSGKVYYPFLSSQAL